MNFIDSKTDLFKDLPESHRRAIMDAASSIVLEKRQRLFFQGDPAQHVYLIDQGVFKLYETTRSGETSIFWFLGPGELMALSPVHKTRRQGCGKWRSDRFSTHPSGFGGFYQRQHAHGQPRFEFLSSWKKRGWIVSRRERIIVKNPEAIQGIATEEERLN